MRCFKLSVYSSLLLMLTLAVEASPLGAQTAAAPEPPAAGVAAPTNPLRLALLRWYLVNTTTRFTVGNQPYGVCFDGANIWTANYGGGSENKVGAGDGTALGAVNAPPEPQGGGVMSADAQSRVRR